MLKSITDSSFEQEVLQSKQPVLVDFWAEWCGPCRSLSEILSQVSEELKDKIKIVKLNIDENPEAPTKYGVRGIPTMILFKGGEQYDSKVGALPKETIKKWLEDL